MTELSIRDKKMLVAGIKDSYQLARDAWASAIEQSIACGGKLAYVKGQLEHGQWLPFLEACDIPRRTASELIKMHENRELLRDKTATTWDDAKRIISEANANGQCTAHLTSQPTSESADPNVQSVVRLEATPVVEVVALEPTETAQPELPQSEVEPSGDVDARVRELGRRAWEQLSTDQQRRRESIDASATFIHSLDECEIELLADLVTRRVKSAKISSLVRIMSVAVTIPDLIDLLFDAFRFEDDGTEKDGYIDTLFRKALALKIGEEKAAEVLAGETSLRWAKSEPVSA